VGDPSRTCLLLDAGGKTLAREGAQEASPGTSSRQKLRAEATVISDGWSQATPWKLSCEQDPAGALARVEPLAGRYRLTLLLNAAVMSLTLLLGAFAIQQAQKRARLESEARQEARVRELERQLFHAERLSTVGRLAAGIAHEINNPLEGISNYLTLARQDLSRGEAESVARRLDGVQEGLRRAEAIVRWVLAHSDPAGAPRTQVDLSEVLRQSLGFVRERSEFSHLRYDLDLPSAPILVRGNAAMLGQVFLNLMLNACEAQPGQGEVRVAARREDGRVVAEIADRGPGVPLSDAQRVFEPFYSTKNSSGLGLSICYSIARSHDAQLRMEPRAGGGTVFKMIFDTREGNDA
jgi:two-component system C4-dicarboxylate transport sensor histidine kinase DctB